MRLLFLLFILSLSGHAQLYFPPTNGENWETIDPEILNWCPEKIDTLLSFLEDRNSKAFIILKDGKIVIEAYFNDHNENSLWYWASAGKTITATLAGKAMEDGALNLDDPVSQYLGTGWTACDSLEEAQRTIWNQLTMTSSFNNSVLYWDCTEPSCFQCTELEPGTQWHYHNGVYRLLIEVIESATGLSRNSYTDMVIEETTGMNGFWTDNLYWSKHRDMARFGLLALNGFNWNGTEVLSDPEYIQNMTTPSQNLNPSYGYLWWLNGQSSFQLPLNPISFPGSLIPSGPDDMFMALGANDQKIYVVPSQNLVVTRQGDEAYESTFASSAFDTDLWELISDLSCETTGIEDQSEAEVKYFPNPSTNGIRFPSHPQINRYEIVELSGRQISTGNPGEWKNLSPGIYLIRALNSEKVVQINKVVIL